jgi:integrase
MYAHKFEGHSVRGSRGLIPAGLGRKTSGPSGNLRRGERELRRARILDQSQIERVLAHIQTTSNSPYSDEVKFVLSVFAGLRAGEIAGMTMEAVVDADDEIGEHIIVGRHAAKRGRERVIPMHPRVREALVRFKNAHPDVPFLAFSARGRIRRQSAPSVKFFFSRVYREVGLHGCSSHSGRRTFITHLARLANLHGHSLRDVQILAGHSRLDTTAAYIEPAEELSGLVAAFGRRTPTPASKEGVEV